MITRSPRWTVAPQVSILLMSALFLLLPLRVFAQVPQDVLPTAPKSALEAAVHGLLKPVQQRITVRNDAGSYDLWLVSGLDFDRVTEYFRAAISAKKQLGPGLRVQPWTYLEPDRSYLMDLTGASRPYRLRLTRHLAGTMLEMLDAGEASDAPRWSPAYRAKPILLLHGAVR